MCVDHKDCTKEYIFNIEWQSLLKTVEITNFPALPRQAGRTGLGQFSPGWLGMAGRAGNSSLPGTANFTHLLLLVCSLLNYCVEKWIQVNKDDLAVFLFALCLFGEKSNEHRIIWTKG